MNSLRRGFTIVELLIVCLILTIIAVIAVPRFMGAATDTREARLETDIKTVRQAIERYRLEHDHNRGPHLDETGTLDMANFRKRLTGATTAAGKVDPDASLGPYLHEWPTNPFVPADVSGDILVGAVRKPKRNGRTGWYYDINSCTFSANSTTGALNTDLADGEQAAEAKVPLNQ
ncbi:MAG: type II secretion system protein, partial [Phycisphaerae bacterium]